MNIVVGCPVAKRSWVLPLWFQHVFEACETARLEPEFVFVAPEWDIETLDIIKETLEGLNKYDIVKVDEPEPPERRNWGPARIEHMVELRNKLLTRVRQIVPTYFWSLDSDVLPHPKALLQALKTFDAYDCSAIGGHLYMSPIGRQHGSKGQLANNHLVNRMVHETELEGVYPVDVVMACVLMNHNAYGVDYAFHREGEDLGWAINAKERGLRLMWDARILAKHVMYPQDLAKVDPRVGF